MKPLSIQFNVERVHCFKHDDSGSKAEPYIWIVFFKVDGDTVSVNDELQFKGTSTVVGSSGNHGNLAEVSSGESTPIPSSIGRFQTRLKPIDVPSSSLQIPGIIGCFVVLNEEDLVPSDGAITEGYSFLVNEIKKEFDILIPTLRLEDLANIDKIINELKGKIKKAVKDKIATCFGILQINLALHTMTPNKDDKIGDKIFYFFHDKLEKNIGKSLKLEKEWKKHSNHIDRRGQLVINNHWKVEGEVTISEVLPDVGRQTGEGRKRERFGLGREFVKTDKKVMKEKKKPS